jgi:hypothetical protein
MQDRDHGAASVEEIATSPAPPVSANGNADTGDLHELLRALQAMRMGDFSVRMSGEATGLVVASSADRRKSARSPASGKS